MFAGGSVFAVEPTNLKKGGRRTITCTDAGAEKTVLVYIE
jgi:hypothetical protein